MYVCFSRTKESGRLGRPGRFESSEDRPVRIHVLRHDAQQRTKKGTVTVRAPFAVLTDPLGSAKGKRAGEGHIGGGRKEAACLARRRGRGLRKEAETRGVGSERCGCVEVEDRNNGAVGYVRVRRISSVFRSSGPSPSRKTSFTRTGQSHSSGRNTPIPNPSWPANQVRT